MTQPAPAPAPAPTPPAPTPPAAPPAPTPTAPTPPAPQQPPAPAPGPPVPQPPTWTPPAPPAPADDSEDLARLPKKWQDEVRKLRDENAQRRVSERTEKVLRHAYTTAGAHGVNPEALLGSLAFAEHAKTLDPGAPDFPAKLAEAVRTALAANPWLATQPASATPPAAPPPAPPTSGVEFPGGNTAGQPISEAQLAQMTPDEINKAYSEGRLKHLL